MAYTVKVGTFAKNIESTAQPNTTGWTEYSVTLKNGADISNPQITIAAAYIDIAGANYAVMFDRYYWITRKNMLREGYCVLQLEVDVLATYKTEIGSSSLYILRASAASDGAIIDNIYPATGHITYGHAEQDLYPSTALYANGFYVLNISGVATAGASTLWVLTPDNFRAFISALYSSIDGFQFADIWEALQKLAGGSPTKLVSSAMWFPGTVSFDLHTAEEIVVGGWHSGVQGALIDDPISSITPVELTLTKHPQAASRGKYLNLAPYSTYTLTMPMFGSINIDTTSIIDASKIYVVVRVDALSGQAKAYVHSGGNPRPVIAVLTAQMGVPIPLAGQTAGDSIAGGITATLGSVAAAIISGGAAVPIIGAVSAGIGTAVTALSGASFSSGSGGSALNAGYIIELDSTHLEVVDEDNARRGRPYCQVTTPSSLTGFMIADRGDVVMSGPLPEHEKVKTFLESGFYYE